MGATVLVNLYENNLLRFSWTLHSTSKPARNSFKLFAALKDPGSQYMWKGPCSADRWVLCDLHLWKGMLQCPCRAWGVLLHLLHCSAEGTWEGWYFYSTPIVQRFVRICQNTDNLKGCSVQLLSHSRKDFVLLRAESKLISIHCPSTQVGAKSTSSFPAW